MEDIKILKENILRELEITNDLKSLENIRVKYIGKKGILTNLIKKIYLLSENQKKIQGKYLNQTFKKIHSKIIEKKEIIEKKIVVENISKDIIDISTPIYETKLKGTIHPISQGIHEILNIFHSMGFQTVDGPEIENEFYNFTALNFPIEHPARESRDTFYLSQNEKKTNIKQLLRTHTSPVQIRSMLNKKPPLAIIAPGKVYRPDSDQTHSPIFHQIEGLWLAKNIHMGHLKYIILKLCKKFFQKENLNLRFRPSYFPFTEPSAEVDIGFTIKENKIHLGGNSNWLEVLGCGIIHKNVLINCNINPEKYQGFAFGIGVERFIMLKYGIKDLREFYESNLGWIYKHGFNIIKSF